MVEQLEDRLDRMRQDPKYAKPLEDDISEFQHKYGRMPKNREILAHLDKLERQNDPLLQGMWKVAIVIATIGFGGILLNQCATCVHGVATADKLWVSPAEFRAKQRSLIVE